MIVTLACLINTNTGDYGRPTAAISRAANNVLYMKKHTQTNASYPAMDISCMVECRSRSREHALCTDASRAAYLLGSPPVGDEDLELEGGVNVSYIVKIWLLLHLRVTKYAESANFLNI